MRTARMRVLIDAMFYYNFLVVVYHQLSTCTQRRIQTVPDWAVRGRFSAPAGRPGTWQARAAMHRAWLSRTDGQ